MKRLLSALLTAVAFTSSAFAIVGGPWDAGVPGNPNKVNPANINGTYQGTIKGSNITGVMTFQTSGSNGIAFSGTTGVPTGTTQVQGAAVMFFEGTTAFSTMSVAIDLGGRKLAGVLSGGSTAGNIIPVIAPPRSTFLYWQLTNNFSFNGYFNANLSKNWVSNSFSGNGNLVVTKFDPALYNSAAVINPNVNPSNYIAAVATPIKVSGVKTSDTAMPLWTTFTGGGGLPTATSISR